MGFKCELPSSMEEFCNVFTTARCTEAGEMSRIKGLYNALGTALKGNDRIKVYSSLRNTFFCNP